MFFSSIFFRNFFVLVSLIFSSIVFAADISNNNPQRVDLEPSRIFAPTGFDSNDNAQVVLTGVLPDTCHRLGPARVRAVDPVNKVIVIDNQAYRYSSASVGKGCSDMTMPYVRTVDIGILPEGKYKIYSVSTHKAKAQMSISEARTASPDEYLYAPVSEISLRRTLTESVLVLKGNFLNGCMRIANIKVISSAKNHVIEVLPIMDNRIEGRDDSDCHGSQALVPFEKVVKLPAYADDEHQQKRLIQGEYLIHVRSLSGQSLNTVQHF